MRGRIRDLRRDWAVESLINRLDPLQGRHTVVLGGLEWSNY